jgi:hypothetical protein
MHSGPIIIQYDLVLPATAALHRHLSRIVQMQAFRSVPVMLCAAIWALDTERVPMFEFFEMCVPVIFHTFNSSRYPLFPRKKLFPLTLFRLTLQSSSKKMMLSNSIFLCMPLPMK